MPLWMRIDVHYFNHPKVIQLPPLAQLLYLRAVGYSKLHLTDGKLSTQAIRSIACDLAASIKGADVLKTIDDWVTGMVAVGLFEQTDVGVDIHDFLEWNQSKQEVEYINELRRKAGKKGGRPKANESKTKANDLANEKQAASELLSKSEPIVHSTEFIVHSSKIIDKSSENKEQRIEVKITRDVQTRDVQKRSREAKSSLTWDSYKAAYENRYGVPPVRNASCNSLLCQLVDKLGQDKAPAVAAYYLTHPSSFYATAGHSLNLLVRDAQKLLTESLTGQTITMTQARQDDGRAARGQMWQRLIAKDAATTKEKP